MYESWAMFTTTLEMSKLGKKLDMRCVPQRARWIDLGGSKEKDKSTQHVELTCEQEGCTNGSQEASLVLRIDTQEAIILCWL